MKFACPKCRQVFEGKPNFCPHCGAKLNWPTEEPVPPKKEVVEEPAQEAPRKPAPQREEDYEYRPAPRQPRPEPEDEYEYRPHPRKPVVDDDEPYYASAQAHRPPRQKIYALPFKIIMISASGMIGLFSLICLLTYIGDFIAVKSAYGGAGTSGYKLAFTFDEGAIFVGAFIGFLCVLAVIGLSIPKILSDVKFFKAKPNTMKVARRRSKSIMWLILLSSILLIGIVFVFCSKAFMPSTYSSYYELGGGAIGTAILMIFMLMFNVAEEVIVLSAIRLQPRYSRY